MSLKSHQAGRLAAASLVAAAALGAAASSAQAANLKLNYECKYPLIGVHPLTVDIDAAIPSTWSAGKQTEPFTIKAVATANGSVAGALKLINAKTLEGIANAEASITAAGGTPLQLDVPINVNTYSPPSTGWPKPLVLDATGYTPALLFSKPSSQRITVDKLTLNLTAREESGKSIPLVPVTTDLDGQPITAQDADPGTFDVPCKLLPGQSTELATLNVVSEPVVPSNDTSAPTKPGNVQSSSTASQATLTWSASSDNVGVTNYEILQGGNRVAVVSGTRADISGLTGGSSYSFQVVARDAAGNKAASDTVSVTTPAGGVNLGALAKYSAALTGTATMRTLTQGNLPLKGGIDADMTVLDGKITADLKLNTTTGRLNAIGFLPVTAKIGFVPSGKTTGTLKDGVLTTLSSLRIKLLEIKLFGAIPLAGGNNCQSKQLSRITLVSGQNFDPVAGGAISGNFALSELNNCGILTGIVSPIASGNGNRINATLTPKL